MFFGLMGVGFCWCLKTYLGDEYDSLKNSWLKRIIKRKNMYYLIFMLGIYAIIITFYFLITINLTFEGNRNLMLF